MREAIERLITDFEGRLKIVDEEVLRTEKAVDRKAVLENMFSSGSKASLEYCIQVLKMELAKEEDET